MTKVAVTGAFGYIGRHVLHELSKRDVEIIAVARPSASHQRKDFEIRCLYLDLAQPSEEVFDELGKPDILIHLAWQGLPNYRSLHHFESELSLQYRFLKAMVTGGLQSLLVSGTCFEYGMQSGALAEDSETRPTNPYGFAKDILRRQLEYLREVTPFDLVWTRLFYNYGEGQPASSLLPQLKRAVEQGLPRFDMSRGEQLRDFLPVTEVARYLVSLALQRKDIGVINVCSGTPISVRALVEQWIRENGWKIELNLGAYPYPEYEPLAFWGVRHKLNAALEES